MSREGHKKSGRESLSLLTVRKVFDSFSSKLVSVLGRATTQERVGRIGESSRAKGKRRLSEINQFFCINGRYYKQNRVSKKEMG